MLEQHVDARVLGGRIGRLDEKVDAEGVVGREAGADLGDPAGDCVAVRAGPGVRQQAGVGHPPHERRRGYCPLYIEQAAYAQRTRGSRGTRELSLLWRDRPHRIGRQDRHATPTRIGRRPVRTQTDALWWGPTASRRQCQASPSAYALASRTVPLGPISTWSKGIASPSPRAFA